MDLHYLQVLNLQLQSLIEKRQREIEAEELQLPAEASINLLFAKGCGFTEFLINMFSFLTWTDLRNCRLVSTRWKQFIDRSNHLPLASPA